jgi:hypothetical protein
MATPLWQRPSRDLRNDTLSRKHASDGHHAREVPAAADDGLLNRRMDGIQNIAGFASLSQLEHWPVLEVKQVAGRHVLHVQAAHGQVLAHGSGLYRVAFGTQLLEQFDILEANRAMRSAVLLVIVPVADQPVHPHLRTGDPLFRYAAGRDADGYHGCGLPQVSKIDRTHAGVPSSIRTA